MKRKVNGGLMGEKATYARSPPKAPTIKEKFKQRWIQSMSKYCIPETDAAEKNMAMRLDRSERGYQRQM